MLLATLYNKKFDDMFITYGGDMIWMTKNDIFLELR